MAELLQPLGPSAGPAAMAAIPARRLVPAPQDIEFDPAVLAPLTPEDRALFQRFAAGPTVAPRFPTILAAFRHFARRQPEAVAAVHQGQSISYGALDAASDRVARVLRTHGVRPGDAVGLYLQRSIGMLAGILGAMKAGAAYIPQHLGVAPDDVLRHAGEVTGARVLLSLSHLTHPVPVAPHQTLIQIDRIMFDPALDSGAPTLPDRSVTPDSTCMILFTSGTTGVPNGVRVTHRNLCNILLTAPGDLGIRPGTRVGQILSIAFDMAAWESLGCLANGGTLVIRGKSIQETAEQVDVLIATPSILNALDAGRCRAVRTAAVAGEPCPRPLADLWGGFCRFYNSCGPTETTIVNTAERHTPGKPQLTIGRPTPNNTVYILDENLQPLPIGAPGEMWAGGDCVTAGYLANDALNAERYRPDPFLGGGRMMFRTRDLGRWTPEGELEHLGRVDDQVKVRGFRVELDGVSAALETAPGCGQAVTLKYDDRTLVAFVSPEDVDTDAARAIATERLPYYAVPAVVLALDDLPRTARGKIDKRALLDAARAHIDAAGPELG